MRRWECALYRRAAQSAEVGCPPSDMNDSPLVIRHDERELSVGVEADHVIIYIVCTLSISFQYFNN